MLLLLVLILCLTLGPFFDSMVAKSKETETGEIPNENVITPAVSPEKGNYGSSYPDDEFIRASMEIDTSDPKIRKKLLEKHAMNYKTAHDPEFATSPISIKEKDYDFMLICHSYLLLKMNLFMAKKMIMP